jgi:leader peptidase (prepilin peptidase)/N-methyltransferase
MTLLTATLMFILGTTIGSFLSVVIYRLYKKKKGILLSRSICPECKKQLKWRHLIPILSWLFLRGKCAYCGKKISSHYLVLELLTGLLFLAAFLQWNFIEEVPSSVNPEILNYMINWDTLEILIFYLIEFTFLIAIFFYDLMHKEIPDRLSFPAIVIAITGGLIFGEPSPLNMVIGGGGIFLFFALQLILSKGKWIGGGDLRLGALMGILLGWEKGLIALVLAYLIGAVVSIILLIQKKVTQKSTIPFGPFLITGIIIALFYGTEIINWYLNLLIL